MSDATDTTEEPRQVLPEVSVHPEFLGKTYLAWVRLAIPTGLMLYVTANVLPRGLQMYGVAAAVVVALATVGAVLCSPSHLTAGEWVEQRVNYHVRQPMILHDSNPERSGIEQPENTTLTRRVLQYVPLRAADNVARTLTGALPWGDDDPAGVPVDPEAVEGDHRTQDYVPVERAFRGEYAVECEDGSFVGAIRVSPANMSTADSDDWQRQVSQLASIITSSVDYDCQLDEVMRAVDYSRQVDTYEQRMTDLRQRSRELADAADSETVRVGSAGDLGGENRMATDTLADIAEERAAVMDLTSDTTLVREHYVIVRVDPIEVAVTASDDRGGIENIPGLGDWLTRRRMNQQLDSEEHTEMMLDLVNQRVETLSNKLGMLEDIKAVPISSVNYAQVIADYYRGANVYANEDFNSLVRESPTPSSGDPTHDVDYDPVRRGTGVVSREEWGTPRKATDGGPTTMTEDETGRIRQAIADSPIPVLDDADRSERLRSLLAPEVIKPQEDPGYVKVDGQYVATVWVDEWPAVPRDGMMKEILAYSRPGVEVTMSTHLSGLDKDEAKSELRKKANSLKSKWQDAAEEGHIETDEKRREYETAADLKDALEVSDHGLFEVGAYITVRAETEDDLDAAVNDIKSRLKEAPAHARGIRADFNHLKGFKSSAPVGEDLLNQRVKMRGDGVASLFPYASHNITEPTGIQIGTHEERHEPTIIDLFSRETGYNFGIFGNIRTGKTTTMGEVLLRLKLKRPEINMAVIDPLEEYAGLCKLFDGERVVVGSDTAINPLHIEPTPPELLNELGRDTPFKDAVDRSVEFVGSYYELEGREFGDKKGLWEIAIKQAYKNQGITRDPSTHDNDNPLLTDVFDVFEDMVRSPGDYVPEGLAEEDDVLEDRKETAIDILNNDIEPFREGGKYEHLTRPTEIDLLDSGMVYLDLQKYENDSDTGLMMQLLVSQIYEMAKTSDHPSVLGIDESHYLLKQQSMLDTLKENIRHSGHSDLAIGFASQSISEFFSEGNDGETLTDSAEVIVNNLSMKVYHYLAEMNEEWAEELDLTEQEMKHILDADPGNEQRGYSQALLQVDQEGCFPIKVEMSDDLNPREFAVLRYDQRKHPSDLAEYLERYDRHAAWSWMDSHPAATDGGDPA